MGQDRDSALDGGGCRSQGAAAGRDWCRAELGQGALSRPHFFVVCSGSACDNAPENPCCRCCLTLLVAGAAATYAWYRLTQPFVSASEAIDPASQAVSVARLEQLVRKLSTDFA